MCKLRLNLLIASLFIVPQLCLAQWTPIAATQSSTRIVTDQSGKQIQNSTSEGAYYRSASGSEITVTQLSNPDGTLVSKTAKLMDNDGLGIYTLDYGKKIAYHTGTMNQRRVFSVHSGPYSKALGQEQMDGLDCVILPILENGKLIGKAWKSVKYDLTVKMDFTIDAPGYKTHVITELHNVRVNAKVSSDLLQVPADFKVANAAPTALPGS